ncbi:glycosyltransferase [hydrocarbon metagenome]|uniref:Glycosyltransferase n=1 Tax=hydrocarbon metagenome TaxID=938273 RepID=A0A0W8FMJ9_9ZZZZ
MKICFVSHSYPFFAGDWRSNFIASLAEAYTGLGNEVTVFTPLYSGECRKTGEADKVKIVEYRYMPFKSWHLVGYGSSMKNDTKISKSTILLTPFLLIAGMIKLAGLLKRENYDFLHCHWAVPNALIAVGARWLAGSDAKILTSFPGSDVTVIRNTGTLGKIMAKIIAKSDYLSCNSADLKEGIVRSGIDSEKVDYVIYGVDDKKINFSAQKRKITRERLAINDETTLLLVIGRFIPKKGFSTAFRALKYIVEKHKNIKLAVIGDGDLKNEYVEILKQDKTSGHVIFIGYIAANELADYYSACDIFLMPSEKNPPDGLNTVVPEAMACGRPIVASNVGGNDLVVFDGLNGFLHSEGDYEKLAALVSRLIENESTRIDMGRKSLELIQTKFNWKAIAEYYIEKYKETYGKANRS